MTRMVHDNTAVITNHIETLAGQYKKVNEIEEQLTALRSNVRTTQMTAKDLEIAEAEAQNKLQSDQARLKLLSTQIEERKVQWEARIEGLSRKIQDEDANLAVLQDRAGEIFQEVVKDSKKFQANYPQCFAQIQPMMMSIFQLYQYQASLEKNRRTIESFQELRAEFSAEYLSIMVKTFGQGVVNAVNLNNIQDFINNQIAFEAQRVQDVHMAFARQFGQQAQGRRLRFAGSIKSFNFFVSGFSKEKVEIEMYSDLATKFYSWSATLDKWIKEIYALQLSLDMMVNQWSVKIATRLSDLEALQATEGEIRGTVTRLNSAISQITLAQKTLTAEIRAQQKTVTR